MKILSSVDLAITFHVLANSDKFSPRLIGNHREQITYLGAEHFLVNKYQIWLLTGHTTHWEPFRNLAILLTVLIGTKYSMH